MAIAALILVTAAGLSPPPASSVEADPFGGDPGRFSEAVLRAAPRGSPIDVARRFVKQRGFECSLQINAEFLAREPVRDFVHCIRMSQTMQWEVALFVRDGTLNNVATKSRAIIKGTQ